MTSTPILQMTGISKSFGATRALSEMHLTIRSGEIHALMGENGAGKSTLMKVLSGVHAPDRGDILLDGKPVALRDPGASRAAGINLIYQELAVAPNISVAANVFMGSELRTRWGLIDHAAMRKRTDAVLSQLGAAFRASDRAGRLSIAEQQQVEIARALVHRSRIVIMDEPTAALSERETEHLFGVVRRLRDEGLAIIYISHAAHCSLERAGHHLMGATVAGQPAGASRRRGPRHSTGPHRQYRTEPDPGHGGLRQA
ncbi:ATP-binding cassette domain-containing protein, partial [Herbaspirillum sp. B65]|uniref:ATP-binding cassette domain-containing protein n=1 Tax=Herbaspirillum sp. B65 TaxID=137708 RepID=UPI002090FC6B